MAGKIRITHVLEATGGGTRRHIEDLLAALPAHRFDLSVICSLRRDPRFRTAVDRFRARGIEIREVPMRRAIHPLADFRAWQHVRRHLNALAPDVVHTHSAKGGIVGRWAAKSARSKPRIVHTPHHFPFAMEIGTTRRQLYFWIEKCTGAFTDRIVCVCDQERRLALRRRLVAAEKLCVIENGLDLAAFDRQADTDREAARADLRIPNDAAVLGTVGRLTRQKGHYVLLEALARLVEARPQTYAVIVGDGELRHQLAKRAETLGITECCRFTGHREQTARLYAAFDVFVLPSLWEGLPYALLEAMAAACPIVTTGTGGMLDVIAPDETGILVPTHDAAALANAVHSLLTNRAEAEKLGHNARRQLAERFRLSDMVDQTAALYEVLAGG